MKTGSQPTNLPIVRNGPISLPSFLTAPCGRASCAIRNLRLLDKVKCHDDLSMVPRFRITAHLPTHRPEWRCGVDVAPWYRDSGSQPTGLPFVWIFTGLLFGQNDGVRLSHSCPSFNMAEGVSVFKSSCSMKAMVCRVLVPLSFIPKTLL